MGLALAFLAGYFVGARAGSNDLDQVIRSFNNLRRTEEFGDLVSAVRAHAGHALRQLAAMVEHEGVPADGLAEPADLVGRVRHLFGRE